MILTTSGDIAIAKREADVSFTKSEDDFNWEIDYNQQVQDKKTGVMYQVVSEWSKRPMRIFYNRPVCESNGADALFIQEFDRAKARVEKDEPKHNTTLWSLMIALIFAVIISVFALIALSDKMPSFGG